MDTGENITSLVINISINIMLFLFHRDALSKRRFTGATWNIPEETLQHVLQGN